MSFQYYRLLHRLFIAVNANLGASSEAVAEDALVGLAEDMERGRGEYEEWGEVSD